MSGLDHQEAQRISAQKEADHKSEIARIAEKNRQAHLAASKRRAAAERMAARLRKGLGDT